MKANLETRIINLALLFGTKPNNFISSIRKITQVFIFLFIFLPSQSPLENFHYYVTRTQSV